MKKLFLTLFAAAGITATAQVKVGTNPTSIDNSAMLQVDTTTKGFLPPRMTTAQQAAIASPAKGLVLYNLTLDCLQVNKGTPASPNWECIGASAAPTLVTDCNASRFALSSPAQDPLCNVLFIGTSGYQVKFVLTNNSLNAISGLDLSTAVSLTGAGSAGLTVTAGQNSNVSVNSAASVTLTYNLAGSPTTAGSITATFSRLGLTCTITNTVADPATWAGNGNNGSTALLANVSCLAIKNAFPSSADGAYWIDPDGTCSISAFQAYCDMTADGGGWTLVAKIASTDANANWGYSNALWSNTTLLNPTDVTLADANMKNSGFFSIPLSNVRMSMGTLSNKIIEVKSSSSVQQLFTGAYQTSSNMAATIANWVTTGSGQAFTYTPSCAVGWNGGLAINITATNSRFGVTSDNVNCTDSPDEVGGVGIYYNNPTSQISAGFNDYTGRTGPDPAAVWIFVR